MAAPITPIPPPRFSFVVLSPIKASAVGKVAAENIPDSARATNNIHNWVESPNINRARALPIAPTIRIGLRPTLSEIEPQMGEKTNWNKA